MGVAHDRLAVGLELRRHHLRQGHCFAGHDVHERAALQTGENGAIHFLGKLLPAQDEPAARAAQSLMAWMRSRKCACGTGLGWRPTATRSRNVRHVNHEQRAD